jgi:hypothetical protein
MHLMRYFISNGQPADSVTGWRSREAQKNLSNLIDLLSRLRGI